MLFKRIGRNYNMELSSDRFERQFQQAHKKLNMLIVADSTPYVPFQQGQLRSQVRYPDGIYGDTIEWYAPYAHYQYYGELYLATNGSSWAKSGEVKYPSGMQLTYHEPGTGDMWFERAKEAHKNEWIRTIKRIGGGN